MQFTKGPVTYQYKGAGKWHFTAGNNTLIQSNVGGRENAEKIAAQVAGSFKRWGALDNMARGAIRKLVAK